MDGLIMEIDQMQLSEEAVSKSLRPSEVTSACWIWAVRPGFNRVENVTESSVIIEAKNLLDEECNCERKLVVGSSQKETIVRELNITKELNVECVEGENSIKDTEVINAAQKAMQKESGQSNDRMARTKVDISELKDNQEIEGHDDNTGNNDITMLHNATIKEDEPQEWNVERKKVIVGTEECNEDEIDLHLNENEFTKSGEEIDNKENGEAINNLGVTVNECINKNESLEAINSCNSDSLKQEESIIKENRLDENEDCIEERSMERYTNADISSSVSVVTITPLDLTIVKNVSNSMKSESNTREKDYFMKEALMKDSIENISLKECTNNDQLRTELKNKINFTEGDSISVGEEIYNENMRLSEKEEEEIKASSAEFDITLDNSQTLKMSKMEEEENMKCGIDAPGIDAVAVKEDDSVVEIVSRVLWDAAKEVFNENEMVEIYPKKIESAKVKEGEYINIKTEEKEETTNQEQDITKENFNQEVENIKNCNSEKFIKEKIVINENKVENVNENVEYAMENANIVIMSSVNNGEKSSSEVFSEQDESNLKGNEMIKLGNNLFMEVENVKLEGTESIAEKINLIEDPGIEEVEIKDINEANNIDFIKEEGEVNIDNNLHIDNEITSKIERSFIEEVSFVVRELSGDKSIMDEEMNITAESFSVTQKETLEDSNQENNTEENCNEKSAVKETNVKNELMYTENIIQKDECKENICENKEHTSMAVCSTYLNEIAKKTIDDCIEVSVDMIIMNEERSLAIEEHAISDKNCIAENANWNKYLKEKNDEDSSTMETSTPLNFSVTQNETLEDANQENCNEKSAAKETNVKNELMYTENIIGKDENICVNTGHTSMAVYSNYLKEIAKKTIDTCIEEVSMDMMNKERSLAIEECAISDKNCIAENANWDSYLKEKNDEDNATVETSAEKDFLCIENLEKEENKINIIEDTEHSFIKGQNIQVKETCKETREGSIEELPMDRVTITEEINITTEIPAVEKNYIVKDSNQGICYKEENVTVESITSENKVEKELVSIENTTVEMNETRANLCEDQEHISMEGDSVNLKGTTKEINGSNIKDGAEKVEYLKMKKIDDITEDIKISEKRFESSMKKNSASASEESCIEEIDPVNISEVDKKSAENANENTYDTNVGKWMLFLNKQNRDENGDTELDRVWKEITKLVGQGDLFVAKCSTAVDECGSLNKDENGVIICYTADYTNVDDVKKAADIIRNTVFLPKPIFYKTDKATYEGKYRLTGSKNISLYKHDVYGRLFIRDGSRWKAVSTKMVKPENFMPENPSEIQSTAKIIAHENDNSPYDNNAGKWMLFFDRVKKDDQGYTELDRAWIKIKGLVEEGILCNAVCTTGMKKSPSPNSTSTEGPIFCYTHHYGDITDAKRAADAIRSVVSLSKDIVYKRNESYRLRFKQNFRKTNSAIYKHTKDCVFYEKMHGKWINRSVQK